LIVLDVVHDLPACAGGVAIIEERDRHLPQLRAADHLKNNVPKKMKTSPIAGVTIGI